MQRGEPLRSTGTNDADEARGADGSPPCAIWGVLNVTPDSFSDGGLYASSSAALARGCALLAEGADVIDVGGESTRPAGGAYGVGFDVVPESEERDRVVPVIRALTEEHGATVSVDTTKPEVARAALEAGARIVNDVSGGRSNELLAAVAGAKAELVLMHNRGRGEVAPPNTTYEDVVEDVLRELFDSVGRAIAAGVAPERIWIDPGLGFAKTPEQSIALLAATARFAATGHRVLVGASRKGFIAYAAPRRDGTAPPPNERLGGTAATVIAAARLGAAAVRVHDVSAMRQALLVASAIDRASLSGRAVG